MPRIKTRKSYSGKLSLQGKDREGYKSTSTWIYSLYRRNKSTIDNKLAYAKTENKLEVFKHLILEKSGKKLTDAEMKNLPTKKLNKYLNDIKNPQKALDKFLWSEEWSDYKTRANENLINTLREHKALNRLKELTGTPKNKKIDFDEIKWDRDDKVYIYRGYRIDLSNSPKGIKFYKNK